MKTDHLEAPSLPVSRATVLAERMGSSELHAVMAAGLAGGTGLSGGACGASGAAIWITGMEWLEDNDDDSIWNSEVFQSQTDDMIDRYMNAADYEFECFEVAGRKFENSADHVAYLSDEGCQDIIDALAAV